MPDGIGGITEPGAMAEFGIVAVGA